MPIEVIKAQYPLKPTMRIPWGSIVAMTLAGCCAWIVKPLVRFSLMSFFLMGAILVWYPLSVQIAHPWQQPSELSAENAGSIFQSLHQGIYRALDFGSEERVYDVLATRVDGNLLENLYLQLRQSLELKEQGGAVARIRNIAYDDGERIDREVSKTAWPGFQYRSTWTVAGTVEHWGHVHERQNQFEAIFTIEPRAGNWKLTRMDITNQTQKSARTTLRKF